MTDIRGGSWLGSSGAWPALRTCLRPWRPAGPGSARSGAVFFPCPEPSPAPGHLPAPLLRSRITVSHATHNLLASPTLMTCGLVRARRKTDIPQHARRAIDRAEAPESSAWVILLAIFDGSIMRGGVIPGIIPLAERGARRHLPQAICRAGRWTTAVGLWHPRSTRSHGKALHCLPDRFRTCDTSSKNHTNCIFRCASLSYSAIYYASGHYYWIKCCPCCCGIS